MDINEIINQYNIAGGSWDEEKIEQEFCIKYIHPNCNILELGSNIGRISIVIAHILKEGNGKLVTLETNSKIYEILIKNKNNNKLDFIAINKALGKREISQVMTGNNWTSYPTNEISNSQTFKYFSDKLTPVNSITFDNLTKELNIVFDTLVIDCEGAFYFILKDTPEILDNIKLIIIENDCFETYQNDFILQTIQKQGFTCIESRTLPNAWGSCKEHFWKVYKKD